MTQKFHGQQNLLSKSFSKSFKLFPRKSNFKIIFKNRKFQDLLCAVVNLLEFGFYHLRSVTIAYTVFEKINFQISKILFKEIMCKNIKFQELLWILVNLLSFTFYHLSFVKIATDHRKPQGLQDFDVYRTRFVKIIQIFFKKINFEISKILFKKSSSKISNSKICYPPQ